MKYAAYHTPGVASVTHNDDAPPLSLSFYGLVHAHPDYSRPAISVVTLASPAASPVPATTAVTDPASMDPEH